ncbi:MAG: M15 family metallopeptidase [Bacillota bacterium]|nr:M15 family metallopeptidase [Bacillota bacterium]
MTGRKRRKRRLCLSLFLVLSLLFVGVGVPEAEGEEQPEIVEEASKTPKETDVSKGILMLCNKEYRLPEGFEPADLRRIGEEYVAAPGSEHFLQREAAEAFERMSDAARSEGIYLLMLSAYRDSEAQAVIYNNYSERLGADFADSYAARPGHSEHETGLSCDIYEIKPNSPAYLWLLEHAHEFGYILRYPEGKEEITRYSFEAWHWRYVGPFLAKSVRLSGLTYEEYYQTYIQKWPAFVFFFFR